MNNEYWLYSGYDIVRSGKGKKNVKVKCTLQQSHEGPEGKQRYSSNLSLTSALEGVGGKRHAPAAWSPGEIRYLLYRRLGGPPSRSEQVRKISLPLGFDPRTVQTVASSYTDWVIPGSQSFPVNCYQTSCKNWLPASTVNDLPRTTESKFWCGVSDFLRGVNEIFALLISDAALIGSYRRFGTTYRSHLQRSNKEFLVCLTFEDGLNRLYRNVGN